MKVTAWVQMGCERRETTFEVADKEVRAMGPMDLEAYIEEAVLDWINCRLGWGYSSAVITNDFGFMEDDDEAAGLVDVKGVLNPRTERRLVAPLEA